MLVHHIFFIITLLQLIDQLLDVPDLGFVGLLTRVFTSRDDGV